MPTFYFPPGRPREPFRRTPLWRGPLIDVNRIDEPPPTGRTADMCCGKNHAGGEGLLGGWATRRAMAQHDQRVGEAAVRKHIAGQKQQQQQQQIGSQPSKSASDVAFDWVRYCFAPIWLLGGGAAWIGHALVVFAYVSVALAVPVLGILAWVAVGRLRESKGDYAMPADEFAQLLAQRQLARTPVPVIAQPQPRVISAEVWTDGNWAPAAIRSQ